MLCIRVSDDDTVSQKLFSKYSHNVSNTQNITSLFGAAERLFPDTQVIFLGF